MTTREERAWRKAALLFALVDAGMVERVNRAHASHAYAVLVPAANRRLGAWRMTWWRMT